MYENALSNQPVAETRWPLFLAILTISLAFSATSFATAPSFSGTYHLDHGASDDLSAVMEPAFDELNIIKRIAGRRLLKSRVLPSLNHIEVEQGPASLTIDDGTRLPIEIPSSGEEVDHRTERGKWVKLRGELVDNVFQAKITGADGVYHLRSRLCPRQERLEVDVTLEHRDISTPIRFNLVYQRQLLARETLPGDINGVPRLSKLEENHSSLLR